MVVGCVRTAYHRSTFTKRNGMLIVEYSSFKFNRCFPGSAARQIAKDVDMCHPHVILSLHSRLGDADAMPYDEALS